MKTKLFRLLVLAGIFSLAFWFSPGSVAAIPTSCTGTPICSVINGKKCTQNFFCCDDGSVAFCACLDGRYTCG